MTSHKIVRVLAFASALVLVGGGCTLPFTQPQDKGPAPAENTKEADMSGDTLSEQADIIIDVALEESLFEEDAAGDVSEDASLFTSDEQELNNLENSYDENEL